MLRLFQNDADKDSTACQKTAGTLWVTKKTDQYDRVLTSSNKYAKKTIFVTFDTSEGYRIRRLTAKNTNFAGKLT